MDRSAHGALSVSHTLAISQYIKGGIYESDNTLRIFLVVSEVRCVLTVLDSSATLHSIDSLVRPHNIG